MWLLLACQSPTAIRLGSADTGGEPAVLVGDSISSLLPGDTSAEDTAEQPADPDLYQPDTIWQLELTVEGDALRSLQNDGSTYEDATLSWEGRTWPVAIHIKGSSSWQRFDEKPSLVVDVNRIDPEGSFLGAKKFYLHNDCYDPSQMSETLSYRFYREMGYPASETTFAQLTVNGADYGLYTVVEPHEDAFLAKWFADPNGNLYENADAYCDVEDLSCMEKEQVDEGNDDAFRALGDAAKSRGDAWRSAVEPLLDWPRFIDYLALEMAVVHWDSYSYDQSNYSFYHDPTADSFAMLTQSMDLDWGYRPWSYPNCGEYGMDLGKYNMGHLARGCGADASCAAEVRARLLTLADALEAADGASQVVALNDFIGVAVKADNRRYYTDHEYDVHVACLQQFFADRPGQIRTWVAENGG